jgi:hypothetical protein
MTNIVAGPAGGKGLRRLDAIPAPDPSLGLLALLRRPMPLRELRPAAVASGMNMEMVEVALSVATRRGELRIEAGAGGEVLAVRRWP